jgi:hypothetical protein
LPKTAKEAEARARSFERQIASANARAKEADACAVQAQLNLAKLEAPRTLSPDQQRRVAGQNKKFLWAKIRRIRDSGPRSHQSFGRDRTITYILRMDPHT